ncbi:MAG: hypothetical protein ABSA93_20195 [Streptosporangiaceae bacterium]|jgi:uncharacterized protein
MPPATVLPGWFDDAIQGLVAGDEVIIEADGHHRRIEDGAEAPFDVRYVWFITVRDGRVEHFTDYTLPGRH